MIFRVNSPKNLIKTAQIATKIIIRIDINSHAIVALEKHKKILNFNLIS